MKIFWFLKNRIILKTYYVFFSLNKQIMIFFAQKVEKTESGFLDQKVPVTLKLSYFQCIFKSFIYFDIYVYIYPRLSGPSEYLSLTFHNKRK